MSTYSASPAHVAQVKIGARLELRSNAVAMRFSGAQKLRCCHTELTPNQASIHKTPTVPPSRPARNVANRSLAVSLCVAASINSAYTDVGLKAKTRKSNHA